MLRHKKVVKVSFYKTTPQCEYDASRMSLFGCESVAFGQAAGMAAGHRRVDVGGMRIAGRLAHCARFRTEIGRRDGWDVAGGVRMNKQAHSLNLGRDGGLRDSH